MARDLEQSGEEDGICEKYKDMYCSLFQDVTLAIVALKKVQKGAEEIFIKNVDKA